MEFNHTGELLATGDKGGRVVIFQQEIEVIEVELPVCHHRDVINFSSFLIKAVLAKLITASSCSHRTRTSLSSGANTTFTARSRATSPSLTT